MQHLLKSIDRLNRILMYLVGIILAVMTVVVTLQIFSRFILKYPLPWSEELARYLMIWLVFLASSLALRKQALIGLEAIAERLSGTARKYLKTVVYLICSGFFVFLLIKGIDMLDHVKMQRSPAMKISMAWPYAAIPVGSFFLLLNSLAVLIELHRKEEQ
ncbi:TRAP transporter small permease [Bacillaceae bacterium]